MHIPCRGRLCQRGKRTYTCGTAAERRGGLSARPVLTVGETAHFVQDGGIVGFRLEEKKVRFEINVGAAEKARLKVSAKLLALAKTVLGNPRRD
jgi:YfiR/HmsC-like